MPILLTAFIAQESNRPVIDFVEAGKGSLHPAALLTGLFANLYGAAGPLDNFWGAPSPAWTDERRRRAAARDDHMQVRVAAPVVAVAGGTWTRKSAASGCRNGSPQ